MIPKAAVFSAAAISYTLKDIQYICIQGVEICPYPQALLGLHASLSFDESLGTAKTTPVKDVIKADVKGGVKSFIANYCTKRQLASTYASFQDEMIPIIAGLDPKKPIVVTGHSMGAALVPLVAADIYSAMKQKKLELSLIMFAAYKPADTEFRLQLDEQDIDAATYNVQDDPVPNVTGIYSFQKGFGESLPIPIILSYTKEIEAERLKSKTRVCSQRP